MMSSEDLLRLAETDEGQADLSHRGYFTQLVDVLGWSKKSVLDGKWSEDDPRMNAYYTLRGSQQAGIMEKTQRKLAKIDNAHNAGNKWLHGDDKKFGDFHDALTTAAIREGHDVYNL